MRNKSFWIGVAITLTLFAGLGAVLVGNKVVPALEDFAAAQFDTNGNKVSIKASSRVWTNDGQIIHLITQPTNAISITASNGGIMLGSNTHAFWGTYALKEALVSYHDATAGAGDVDYNEIYIGANSNGVTSSFDVYMDHTFAVLQLQSGTTGTIFDAEDQYVYYYTVNGVKITPNNIFGIVNNTTKLYPQAPNDGTVPYIFGTTLAKTSGNLFIVTNFNGTVPLRVQFDGLHYGLAGNGITLQDKGDSTGLQLFADDVGRPSIRFDTAGGIEFSLQTKSRLARFNAQTNLVSSAYDETDFALASITNALVNLSSNSVTVAPGAGTLVSTGYVGGKVIYTISDSEVASTMVLTNFVLNQVYTNTSVQPILVRASAYLVSAAVNGDCSLDLMYSKLGNTSYFLVDRVARSTVVTGFAVSTTNSVVGIFTNLGSYYFTNTSSGGGNSAGLVDGTGQYVIIGGGAVGPTGAAGASGSSGVTWATNAIGSTVGGASNEVFLVDTNLLINATNTATAGGTNTIKFSTAQPLNTNASPSFLNLAVTGPTLTQNGNAVLTNVIGSIGTSMSGGGSALATGIKGYLTVAYSGRLTGWSITSDGSSPTCTIDVWKVATGTALPAVANTIMGTKPALTTGNALRSTTMTSWTTTFTAGDIFGFNLDAVTSATNIVFVLETLR